MSESPLMKALNIVASEREKESVLRSAGILARLKSPTIAQGLEMAGAWAESSERKSAFSAWAHGA